MQFQAPERDRSQDRNQTVGCLRVPHESVPSHSLWNRQQDQRLFWTWAKKMKVGKMSVVNMEANKALGESYNLTHWNPHLRTLVNGNGSIKILEMWNEAVF